MDKIFPRDRWRNKEHELKPVNRPGLLLQIMAPSLLGDSGVRVRRAARKSGRGRRGVDGECRWSVGVGQHLSAALHTFTTKRVVYGRPLLGIAYYVTERSSLVTSCAPPKSGRSSVPEHLPWICSQVFRLIPETDNICSYATTKKQQTCTYILYINMVRKCCETSTAGS